VLTLSDLYETSKKNKKSLWKRFDPLMTARVEFNEKRANKKEKTAQHDESTIRSRPGAGGNSSCAHIS
jgi:hypothetical protein